MVFLGSLVFRMAFLMYFIFPKGPKWLKHLPSEGVNWGGFKGFLYLLRRYLNP